MKAYIEAEKDIARRSAISAAVKTVTKHRLQSTLARKSYVREVKHHLQNHGGVPYDRILASQLSWREVEQWEAFYLSIIGRKKPSDLKVAYLSGPNPENDIRVFVENGVLPENIWAFESDNKVYDQAVMSALESDFPFVKIYKGKIENYFKILPTKFDIIYLDFCGTVATSQTVSVIREAFYHQKLNSPGVIVTNFAFPKDTQANKQTRSGLISLAANYLFPKLFTEKLTNLGGGWQDSAECCGLSEDDFIRKAFRSPDTFYSQFITRVLFDLPSVLIPWQRFCSNEFLTRSFFREFQYKALDSEFLEDLHCFPNDYPLAWSLESYTINNATQNNMSRKFITQLALNGNEQKLINDVKMMYFFMSERIDHKFYSDKLAIIDNNWKPLQKHVFCDVFLFHQLKDILIGQVTSPYLYNTEFTKRWTYQAKDTRMFLDLVTYDECRYIFDWMPTLDMFGAGIDDLDRQLSLRFAMDALTKHRRWYNEEFFSGTAVISNGNKGFDIKELKRRKKIN